MQFWLPANHRDAVRRCLLPRHTEFIIILLMLVFLVVGGCLDVDPFSIPGDGHRLPTMHTPICVAKGSSGRLRLGITNPNDSEWVWLTPQYVSEDCSAGFTLPHEFWVPGAQGHSIAVVLSDGETPLPSYYAGCTSTVNDGCISHRSPERKWFTEEFHPRIESCKTSVPQRQPERLSDIDSTCDKQWIAFLLDAYITPEVVSAHFSSGDNGHTDFIPWHRDYIKNMERYLSSFGSLWLPDGELPPWDPTQPFPQELHKIGLQVYESTDGGEAVLEESLLPETEVPAVLQLPIELQMPLICNATEDEMLSALLSWHNSVHSALGGVMTSYEAPAWMGFWFYHSYVDSIAVAWEACDAT